MSAIAGIVLDTSDEHLRALLGAMDFALSDHHSLGPSEITVVNGVGLLSIGKNAKIWREKDQIFSRAARFAPGDISDLRDSLGNTDPEDNIESLLIKAFLRFGAEMGEHLYGDYAISAIDIRSKRVDLWRDSSGVKPLFYAELPSKKGFAFASTITALITLPELGREPDFEELAKYLLHQVYTSNQNTFFKHIKILPPGSALRWNNGKLTVTKFWRFDKITPIRGLDKLEIWEGFSAALTRAIEDRTVSDSLVASHISGGVDSTTVALIANDMVTRNGGAPIFGYTWSPQPRDGNLTGELNMLDHVQKRFGIQLRYCGLAKSEIVEIFKRNIFTEPKNTLFSEFNILKQAQADGVRVMLSGWGGDEVVSSNMVAYFGGSFLSGNWAKLSRETGAFNSLKRFQQVARKIYHEVINAYDLSLESRRMYRSQQEMLASITFEPLRSAILATPEKTMGAPGFRLYQHKLWEGGHIFNRISDWDQHGARFGIEYRYPLIDRRLLEFTLALPIEAVFEYPIRGSLMRNKLAKYVSDELAFSKLKKEEFRQSTFVSQVDDGLREFIASFATPDDLVNTLIDRPLAFKLIKNAQAAGGENYSRAMVTNLISFSNSKLPYDG